MLENLDSIEHIEHSIEHIEHFIYMFLLFYIAQTSKFGVLGVPLHILGVQNVFTGPQCSFIEHRCPVN